MRMLFNGWITMNIKLISNDIALRIWNYFNCYNHTEYDFMSRILQLCDGKNGGYHVYTQNYAVSILQSLTLNCDGDVSLLLVQKYDMINKVREILQYG